MKSLDLCKRIAIVHSDVDVNPTPDEQDTLDTALFVNGILESLGYEVLCFPYAEGLKEKLSDFAPCGIFNLVESIGGSDSSIHEAPLAFEKWGYRFCGAGSRAMQLCNDKIAAKEKLKGCGIATPEFLTESRILERKPLEGRYILKARGEHASVGITPESVTDDAAVLYDLLIEKKRRYGGVWFAESYIEGREFNISIIEGEKGGVVLPLAEIEFINFPADRPRIVDYAAKWDSNDPSWHNTPRRFIKVADELVLSSLLTEISLSCWDLFGLKGWARVDFRVHSSGVPFVLEVNANPCLASDAGFMAAAAQAGLTHGEVIARLIKNFHEEFCYA